MEKSVVVMPEQPEWRLRAKSANWARLNARARGRGARSNVSSRYERAHVEPFDDGWTSEDEAVPPLRTQTIPERPKTAITYNTSPDLHFDRTINPYKGCEHGCIYCYARPNHAYRGLSAGLDFETKIFVKTGLDEALKRDLAKKSYEVAPIVLAGDTDIYQPLERELKVTRSILEVLDAHNHPVSLVTKSSMILRDLDILSSMAERGLVSATLSLTTLDKTLARTMEPRASAPYRRLQAIQQLATMGVPVNVLTAPIVPGLNDDEIERMLQSAQSAGAGHAGYVMLRLPLEIEPLFEEWLAAHYPDRASRVMNLVRGMHGGKAYDSRFGHRQRGDGPYAQMIADRFNSAAKRLGLDAERPRLRCDLFRRPEAPVRAGVQLSLFGDASEGMRAAHN